MNTTVCRSGYIPCNKRRFWDAALTLFRPGYGLIRVVDRGYEDYKDYQNQLDAVDLGCPDMEEAWELYKSFAAKGLVAHHKLDDGKIRKREG